MKVGLPEEGYPVRGHLAGTASGPSLQRIEATRRCEEPSCDTLLSAYNQGTTCWQHSPSRPYFVRAPRKRPSAAA
jgi:hypothetical protein